MTEEERQKASQIYHQSKYMESTPGIEFITRTLVAERLATLNYPEVMALIGFLELSVDWNKMAWKMLVEFSGDQTVADKLNRTIQLSQEALANFTRLKESLEKK